MEKSKFKNLKYVVVEGGSITDFEDLLSSYIDNGFGIVDNTFRVISNGTGISREYYILVENYDFQYNNADDGWY